MPISLDELDAPKEQPQSTPAPKPGAKGISIDELDGLKPGEQKTATFSDIRRVIDQIPDSTFGNRFLKTIVTAGTDALEKPENFAKGAAKATVGGAINLGETAAAGVAGLASAAIGKGFGKGMETTQAMAMQVHQLSSAITGLNLAPENKQEEAAGKLLALIPDAIQASGDTVYERTGSAIAGAGAQALLTLLSLDPAIAARTAKGFSTPKTNPGNAKVRAVFEELAIKDPAAARALADHVALGDKKLGQQMISAIDDHEAATEKVQEIIGKKQVKAKLEEQQRFQLSRQEQQLDLNLGPQPPKQLDLQLQQPKGKWPIKHEVTEETGEHIIRSPDGELIAREGEGKLFVERIDVEDKARGQHQGSEMMLRALEEAGKRGLKLESDVSVSPAQERVYETLRKHGYEVKRNPSERNPDTGNLVSKDPKRGVFSVDPKKSSLPKGQLRLDLPVPESEQLQLPLRGGSAGSQLGLTFEQMGSDIRQAVRDGQRTLGAPESPPTIGGQRMADPTLYMQEGKPVTKGAIASAFRLGLDAARRVPGFAVVESKLKAYTTQIVNTMYPELRGKDAEVAGSVIAKNVAEQMMSDSQHYEKSAERRTFWNHRAKDAWDFIVNFEKGAPHADPVLNDVARNYRNWSNEIFQGEKALGFEYEPRDNYLPHLFADEQAAEDFFTKKYGRKWGDPSFIKDRTFQLYQQAIEHGLKPRFTNPEDIMLARQHASDIARMRVQTLRDLERIGLAVRIESGSEVPEGFSPDAFRSPTGEAYYISRKARSVLKGAFESQGLWGKQGIIGDAFRGFMAIKNTIVPIRLASLFHVLHVGLLLDNAAAMTRASKELLSGKASATDFIKQFGSAAVPLKGSFWDNPKMGNRILEAYHGRIPKGGLSDAEMQALGYMNEGGFIPTMSEQYRTSAMQNFRDAVQRRSAKAIFHAPLVPMALINKLIFEKWIPALKTASYLKDVGAALKTDPTLINRPMERQLAFRRIAKSVDDRYGEMAYNTLFMDKMVKDILVANTLSLSWQMGILRQHMGALRDITEMVSSPRGVRAKIAEGKMDRPLFLLFYHAQALAYAGMLTWALTGKPPDQLMDYFFPKSGQKKPDGSDERLSTMFTTREFAAAYKHIQEKGVVDGLGTMTMNKASGVIGLLGEMSSGVNAFGQEIRDPSAPAFQKLEQTMAYALSDIEPIAMQSLAKQGGSGRDIALNVAGLTTAGRYITDTPIQSEIRNTFGKYYAPKQTPFERAQFSEDARNLKTLLDRNDPKYDELLDKMQDRYSLTTEEVKRLETTVRNGIDPTVKMFQRLDWQQQKALLDKMSPEERDTYLPVSNKQHLRNHYIPPEEEP